MRYSEKMQKLYKEDEAEGWRHLHKIFLEMGRLPSMPEHVVRRLLLHERGGELSRDGVTTGEEGSREVRGKVETEGRGTKILGS